MALDSTARAHWEGDLMSGSGTATLDTGVAGPLNMNWKARAEEHGGMTSPEELIAAAHAGCFSMALANALAEAGHPADSVDTRAEVDLSMEGGPTLSAIRLVMKAKVPGIEAAKFREIADDAKQNCPVSRALSAVPITLEAELTG